MSGIGKHFAKTLLMGLFLLLPIGLAWWVLKFLFDIVDGIFQPLISLATDYSIPGAGIAIAIVIIYIFGLIARNFVGQKVMGAIQQALLAIPVFKNIYSITKKLVDSFDPNSTSPGFKKVVLVEYPRKGMFSLGIPVAQILINDIPHIEVYFPTAPTPQSGLIAFFPKNEVRETSMSVKDFMGLTLSLGLSSPATIKFTDNQNRNEPR